MDIFQVGLLSEKTHADGQRTASHYKISLCAERTECKGTFPDCLQKNSGAEAALSQCSD